MDAATFTVLVVDDNADNRSLAKATLEDEGYGVLLATGGEEAIALAANEQPDCILMDIRMPEVDGIVACERIRGLPGVGRQEAHRRATMKPTWFGRAVDKTGEAIKMHAIAAIGVALGLGYLIMRVARR